MRSVLLTDGAARDLDEWYAAAYARGGAAVATQVLDRIEVVLDSLAEGSLREESLPELRPLGKLAERQVVTEGGLRVVFRHDAERVLILMIAPVRRSFQALLERRLLDA